MQEIIDRAKELHSCVDCGTQNCKFKTRTYPEFCPTFPSLLSNGGISCAPSSMSG